jgi:TPR repeat protein
MEKAAELGSRNALTDMGYLLWQGTNRAILPQNKTKAAELFRQAVSVDAKLFGHASKDAAYFLGTMAKQGDGINRNNTLAFEMFELAASLGNRRARFNIGQMHAEGNAPLPEGAPAGSANTCQASVESWKQVAELMLLPQLESARASFLGGNMYQALLLYLSAAEKGSVNGQVNSAWLLEQQAEHAAQQVAAEDTVMAIAAAAASSEATASDKVPQLAAPAEEAIVHGDSTVSGATVDGGGGGAASAIQSTLAAVGESVGAMFQSNTEDTGVAVTEKYWHTTILPDMAEAVREQAAEAALQGHPRASALLPAGPESQEKTCSADDSSCEEEKAAGSGTGAVALGGSAAVVEEAQDAVEAVRFANGASSRLHALRYHMMAAEQRDAESQAIVADHLYDQGSWSELQEALVEPPRSEHPSTERAKGGKSGALVLKSPSPSSSSQSVWWSAARKKVMEAASSVMVSGEEWPVVRTKDTSRFPRTKGPLGAQDEAGSTGDDTSGIGAGAGGWLKRSVTQGRSAALDEAAVLYRRSAMGGEDDEERARRSTEATPSVSTRAPSTIEARETQERGEVEASKEDTGGLTAEEEKAKKEKVEREKELKEATRRYYAGLSAPSGRAMVQLALIQIGAYRRAERTRGYRHRQRGQEKEKGKGGLRSWQTTEGPRVTEELEEAWRFGEEAEQREKEKQEGYSQLDEARSLLLKASAAGVESKLPALAAYAMLEGEVRLRSLIAALESEELRVMTVDGRWLANALRTLLLGETVESTGGANDAQRDHGVLVAPLVAGGGVMLLLLTVLLLLTEPRDGTGGGVGGGAIAGGQLDAAVQQQLDQDAEAEPQAADGGEGGQGGIRQMFEAQLNGGGN